jgi:hypothetical protein
MGWATRVLQWQKQWDATMQIRANPQILSQFGLLSATRQHEVGITSNRGSACRGEFVPKLCTHRPSRPGNSFCWMFFLQQNMRILMSFSMKNSSHHSVYFEEKESEKND